MKIRTILYKITYVPKTHAMAKNGKNSPEGCPVHLDAKSGPLESGDFGDNGDFAKMEKNGQRAGDSIWMPKEALWRSGPI